MWVSNLVFYAQSTIMFYHGDSNMTLTLFCGDSSITHLRLLSCKSVKFRLFLDTFEVRSPNPSMIISSIKHSVSIWVCVECKHQCMWVWNASVKEHKLHTQRCLQFSIWQQQAQCQVTTGQLKVTCACLDFLSKLFCQSDGGKIDWLLHTLTRSCQSVYHEHMYIWEILTHSCISKTFMCCLNEVFKTAW